MKVIIAGGRDFNNYKLLKNSINELNLNISEIITGKAKGADTLGELFAKENKIPIKIFPADWKSYGRAAGLNRNKEMAIYSDALIAFWDKESQGTKSMIDLAKEFNLIINIINY